MPEETQTPAPVAPQAEKKSGNKDFLAPALVFIALFFSFFVLVTMQKLARKAVGNDVEQRIDPVTQVVPTETKGTQTAPSGILSPSEQVQKDSSQKTDVVGDEILKDIDTTNTTNTDTNYDPSSLDDLKQ